MYETSIFYGAGNLILSLVVSYIIYLAWKSFSRYFDTMIDGETLKAHIYLETLKKVAKKKGIDIEWFFDVDEKKELKNYDKIIREEVQKVLDETKIEKE